MAIDETLIGSYEPELKSQSAEWDTPVSARPAKFRRKQGNIKQLAIFAYDNHGILSSHFIPVGQTVNRQYYKYFLQEILRPAIRKKRRELLDASPILLHDNTMPHKC